MPHEDQRAADDAAPWLRDLLGDRRVWVRHDAAPDAEQVRLRRPPDPDDDADRSADDG